MTGMMVIWLLTVIGAFISGMFVYKNNAKKFDGLVGTVEGLPAKKKAALKALLKKYNIEL